MDIDTIQGLHAQDMPGLQSVVSTPHQIDWSVLFEPSDGSDCPSEITHKAVGLPDHGDHACNLVLIG